MDAILLSHFCQACPGDAHEPGRSWIDNGDLWHGRAAAFHKSGKLPLIFLVRRGLRGSAGQTVAIWLLLAKGYKKNLVLQPMEVCISCQVTIDRQWLFDNSQSNRHRRFDNKFKMTTLIFKYITHKLCWVSNAAHVGLCIISCQVTLVTDYL